MPNWSHPPHPNRPAVGGGDCDVTYHVANVLRVPSARSPSANQPETPEPRVPLQLESKVAGRKTTDRLPAKRNSASLTALLKKKLRGRVAYDPQTDQFTLTYDWTSPQQLEDFDLDRADPTFVRGSLVLQGGESISYKVDFQELTVAVPVVVPVMKGKLIRASGGASAYMGGANPDTMYLDGGRGDPVSMIVPDSQRKGLQPVVVTLMRTRIGFNSGIGTPSRLGKAVTDFHAGRVELLGGDSGVQFGRLVLTGVIDEDWWRSFVQA